MKVNQYEWA
jgi:hypothetical protein